MRSEGSCSVWFMNDTRSSNSCNASNMKAGGVTTGGKRLFVYSHLWTSGQILALTVLSLRLDSFFKGKLWQLPPATCKNSKEKRGESSPETTIGEPQSEGSEHSGSGGVRREARSYSAFLLWT